MISRRSQSSVLFSCDCQYDTLHNSIQSDKFSYYFWVTSFYFSIMSSSSNTQILFRAFDRYQIFLTRHHFTHRIFWSSVRLWHHRQQNFISSKWWCFLNLVVCHSPIFVKHFPHIINFWHISMVSLSFQIAPGWNFSLGIMCTVWTSSVRVISFKHWSLFNIIIVYNLELFIKWLV